MKFFDKECPGCRCTDTSQFETPPPDSPVLNENGEPYTWHCLKCDEYWDVEDEHDIDFHGLGVDMTIRDYVRDWGTNPTQVARLQAIINKHNPEKTVSE